MYCSDPGHVEHSTRSLSDPKLLVGTTIQYSCNPGFVLQGGATITCYGREPGTPVWTSGLPHCVCKCRKDERIFFHAGSMSNLFLNFFSPCHYCSWMPEMTLHVLHFRLMTDDLRAPVCALVYLICKCYANAPHQSGLSHLEEGVEIIHESCHFSRSPSKICQPGTDAKALNCFERLSRIQCFLSFPFFCQPRILFPVKTLVSLTTATRSCPRGSTCLVNHSPLSATKGTNSSERPPLSAFWETRHSGADHCLSAGVRWLLIYVNDLYHRIKHPVVLATIAFALGLQS